MECENFRKSYEKYSQCEMDRMDDPDYEQWCEHQNSCQVCSDWVMGEAVKEREFEVEDFPCVHIAYRVTQRCEQHDDPYECPDNIIVYVPQFNEYGIPIHDGGASKVSISNCPWCGLKLPESLRDRWFDELEALGFEDPFIEDVPEKYKTDQWWRESS